MPTSDPIPALLPDGPGHQFVCYADSCSGIPGALHAGTFAAVNAVIRRLDPQPEFICFPGDEISGLTTELDALRDQWSFWFDQEMAWLDTKQTPLYPTTGNHTTYDPASEQLYREVMAHLPRNGPPGKEGLSYWVRRDDLLLVAVHTLDMSLGGEGRLETTWLDGVLQEHADARHKIVQGHHPIFPVNGYAGAYQRTVDPQMGRRFWQILVHHGVTAYLCSHILAFDVQVHEGVLQILTAGAGTAHRMPEEIEYLHCVQGALDGEGLRYQVLDTDGAIREWLQWPPRLPSATVWNSLPTGPQPAPSLPAAATDSKAPVVSLLAWQISADPLPVHSANLQTLLSFHDPGPGPAKLWIGLAGAERRLTVLLAPQPGRSPHFWTGPTFGPDDPLALQLLLHTGMGPGGLLWRRHDAAPWSSLLGASPWGLERLLVDHAGWPTQMSIGHGAQGPTDRPVATSLTVHAHQGVSRLRIR